MKSTIALAVLFITGSALADDQASEEGKQFTEDEIIQTYKAAIAKVAIDCEEDGHCPEHEGEKLWCGHSQIGEWKLEGCQYGEYCDKKQFIEGTEDQYLEIYCNGLDSSVRLVVGAITAVVAACMTSF